MTTAFHQHVTLGHFVYIMIFISGVFIQIVVVLKFQKC